MTASAKIKETDGNKQEVLLKTFGESAFVINNEISDFKQIVATLRFKNGTNLLLITATFKNIGSSENKYECAMHPSELEKDAGKCTKCGMALSAKKLQHTNLQRLSVKGHFNHIVN